MNRRRSLFVLRGEGIECERESYRAFEALKTASSGELAWLTVPELLTTPYERLFQPGDGVFLPGGFSFADHFGSGRLLSYELRKSAFFEKCAEQGVHLWGVCNGFQILTEAGLFGQGVRLLGNRPAGFVNRWVHLEGSDFLGGESFELPVRHGEGRLVRPGTDWNSSVRVLLKYRDPHFENGSVESAAALWAQYGKSRVIGMMPHPEVALKAWDHPDTVAAERTPAQRADLWNAQGSGAHFMKSVMNRWIEEEATE